MRLRAPVVVLAIGAAACSEGAPPRALGERAAAVTKGAPSSADGAVVAIVAPPLSCGPRATTAACTGVLVAPRAVLTAGHCADAQEANVVELGPRVGDASNERRRVVAATRHPKYSRDASDFDLAILWLDAPASAPPLPLPAASDPVPVVGAQLRIVGFGQTRDPAEPDGARRSGTVALSALSPRTLQVDAGPSMSCQGDSGGPVQATIDGVERLVGVISAGDRDCRVEGTAARVDAAIVDEFLRPTLDAPPGAEAGTLLSCEAGCARDADCRPGLVCRQARDGVDRCAISGLEPGELGGACAGDAECGAGHACVTTFDGCRCYAPCAGPDDPVVVGGPDPKRPAAATEVTELEGGCALRAPNGRGWSALSFALALMGARRRRR